MRSSVSENPAALARTLGTTWGAVFPAVRASRCCAPQQWRRANPAGMVPPVQTPHENGISATGGTAKCRRPPAAPAASAVRRSPSAGALPARLRYACGEERRKEARRRGAPRQSSDRRRHVSACSRQRPPQAQAREAHVALAHAVPRRRPALLLRARCAKEMAVRY